MSSPCVICEKPIAAMTAAAELLPGFFDAGPEGSFFICDQGVGKTCYAHLPCLEEAIQRKIQDKTKK